MSLAVPPPNRHRASSTNVRPALTISTLGRRRSSSLVLPVQQNSEPSTPTVDHPTAASIFSASHVSPSSLSEPSMLSLLASKCLELLHVPTQHSINWSTPSSPYPSSDDDLVLPLSSSSQKTAFDDVFTEKQTSKSHRLCSRIPAEYLTSPRCMNPSCWLCFLFPLSTALVFLSLYSLPISVTWPRTLSELAELNLELQRYSQSGPGPLAHVIGVLSVTAVWKHAWSIPGSVIWNVLAGALFHPLWATLLLSALTTMGSVFSTLLCMPLAPSLSRLWPRALEMTRNAYRGSKLKSPAWVRLSILRLVGVVPWSGINIACGVCGVALSDCTLGSFIGCLPWTAVTCQIGDILQTSLLASPDIVLKLVVLSFLSLAPILGRERLRALVLKSPSQQPELDKRNWLLKWPTTIRLPSRSRSHTEGQRLDQPAPFKSALP
ncbi:snare associated Golgi protein-domain-containing protein [Pisolithus microcarpus]|nr:snare associated Golgi protein-domain-containing protein [Pisolithus microcarpus]